MEKKKRISNKIQGLVLFNRKKTYPSKKIDSYTVEKINKEDKIKFVNSLSPQANCYIYSIALNNNGSYPISEVKIKVISPQFLSYLGCFPLTIRMLPIIEDDEEEVKTIEIALGELKEKSSQEISLQFTPYISPAIGEFKSVITYVNNKKKLKILNSEPIKIQIDKLILTPKIIPSSQIREFTQLTGTTRVLMSFGIAISKKKNVNKYFGIIEYILHSQNLQLITKDKERGMLWFCGTDMQSENDILMLSKIGSNQIDIITFSKNPLILTSFLSSFTKILMEQLSMKKNFKSKVKIFELVCINCGAILSHFPTKGESIICNKCNYKQIVW
ncbi:MAG: hypothetical protein ACFE9I_07905 [Candidatus Hermodarchaeota archaeon]